MKNVQLVTGILSRDEYLRAAGCITEFLQSAGVPSVSVAFGFGCDCPDERLYVNVEMPLNRLIPYLLEAEAAGHYEVGKGDLHVRSGDNRFEFLFCHESDMHFPNEDGGLLQRLRRDWLAAGLRPELLLRRETDGPWEQVPDS
jgi:hypothetical protein